MLQSIARRLEQKRLTSSCDLTADLSPKGGECPQIIARRVIAAIGKSSGRKQELYQGVDGQGRPLFPQEGFAVGESANRTVAAGMIVRESGS
jgi:hypothetical protein